MQTANLKPLSTVAVECRKYWGSESMRMGGVGGDGPLPPKGPGGSTPEIIWPKILHFGLF